MYYCICRQIIKTKNRLIYVIILPCLGTVLPVHRSSERMLPVIAMKKSPLQEEKIVGPAARMQVTQYILLRD